MDRTSFLIHPRLEAIAQHLNYFLDNIRLRDHYKEDASNCLLMGNKDLKDRNLSKDFHFD
jgi:hypothetical protein